MGYDIVDAYEDIKAINENQKGIIEALQNKGILPKEDSRKK